MPAHAESNALRGPDPSKALALPNLIGIGGMKCGSSALHYYLDLHPDVSMSRPKELNFFIREAVPEGEFWRIRNLKPIRRKARNRARGLEWYAGHFRADARVRGESSPSYTAPWHPEVPAELAATVPEARLVFMVRDPIERAVSHYLHARASGREQRELDTALRDLRSSYVARSLYYAVLRRFLPHYPMSRILVLDQTDLLLRREETMRGVYRFVGVDESFWSSKFERERNRSWERGGRHGLARRLEATRIKDLAYRLPDEAKWVLERLASPRRRDRPVRPRLDPGVRDDLRAYLRDDAERLRAVTGMELSHWTV